MTAPFERHLRSVDLTRPQPPYPADTSSNGCGFVMDVHRLMQSRTWILTPPELRSWKVLMWVVSWAQVPTGTLPNDDELTAALIGMNLRTFREHKTELLGGWQLHADDRYYHRVITSRVFVMLHQRERWSRNKKGKRSLTSPTPQTLDFADVRADSPHVFVSVSESVSDLKPKTTKQTPSLASLVPVGVRQEVWDAWIAHRGKKLTERGVQLQHRTLQRLGGDPNAIIEQSIENGWTRLLAIDTATPQRKHHETASDRRAKVAREMFGTSTTTKEKHHDDQSTRDITGESERLD